MVKNDKAASKADKRHPPTADQRTKQARQPNRHHKPSPHSQHSTQPAYADFSTQLASLRLRLQPVDGDGNCAFRAIADQVEGTESRHGHYRQLACTHIAEHAELYAPFIDCGDGAKGGGGLKAYVTRMSRMGEWGGNLELVALARALQRDVVVHQLGAPRLVIDGEAKGRSSGSRRAALHVAYHDHEHYSSVRRADDHSVHTEPLPITLPASNAPAAQKQQQHAAAPTEDERRVMAATAIDDLTKVRAALRDMAGDVDSAIEVLYAELDAQQQQRQQGEQQPSLAVQQQLDEGKEGRAATEAAGPVNETVAERVSDVKEAGEAKEATEVKAVKVVVSKAKLSAKELKRVLKAEREERKVQRALERKLERMKEKAQQEGEKGSSAAQAEDATEGIVQDFGSLSI